MSEKPYFIVLCDYETTVTELVRSDFEKLDVGVMLNTVFETASVTRFFDFIGLHGASLDMPVIAASSGERFYLSGSLLKDDKTLVVGTTEVGRSGIDLINALNHIKDQEMNEIFHFLRRLTETIPDMLFIYDHVSEKYVYTNHALTTLLGFSREEFTAMQRGFLVELIHPNDRHTLNEFLGGKSGVAGQDNFECRLRDNKGKWHWLSFRIRPFSKRDHQVVQSLGLGRDITDLKHHQLALAKAKREAERASQAKSTFLANMSHELRTPLNAIIGFSQLLTQQATTLTSEQQEDLTIIVRSGEHLLELINNILAVSKIEAGQMILREGRINLHDVLYDLEDMLSIKAFDKNLLFSFEGVRDLPSVIYVDGGKLRQVLLNLLTNAIKYTDHGGVTLRARFEQELNRTLQPDSPPGAIPGRIFFEIVDTGVGIPDDEVDSLFKSFIQSTESDNLIEGTGLGLKIVHDYVRLLGGEVNVKSQVGHGSTFYFDVAVLKMPDTIPSTRDIVEHHVVAVAPDQPNFRILVVEDRDTNRRLLMKLLESVGLTARSAVNGVEAVEIAREWNPHLVWMDIDLPVMNGIEAIQHIKQTVADEVVVIALSASAFEQERKMLIDVGFDDFMSKPFRNEDIFNKMREHLGISFVYSDPVERAIVPSNDILTDEHLVTLDVNLLQQLKEAAVALDMPRTRQIASELNNPDVTRAIDKWLKGYRFDSILEFINRWEASIDSSA